MTAVTAAAAAQDTFGVFGTTATLLVTDAAALPAARRLADAELAAVDLACSRFRADSELSALNAAGGATTGISELFADLLGEALRAARLTDGAVDPTCGRALAELGYDRDFGLLEPARAAAPGAGSPASAAMPGGGVPGWRSVRLDTGPPRVTLAGGAQLDLGATAKARAADRCADAIARQLGCGVLVSLGGDIAVAGPAPAGGWQIRVTDDHAAGPDAAGQTVAITSGGLATSSTAARRWRRGGDVIHHILDPRTGLPAAPVWRTVSVAALSCAAANTASTAAIIQGRSAIGWLTAQRLPARLVGSDGAITTVAGWPSDPPSGHQDHRISSEFQTGG